MEACCGQCGSTRWEVVDDMVWEGGAEEVQYFYSFGTDNNDLSSMCLDYGFKGGVGSVAPRWMGEQHVGKYFKSRENFFVFAKFIFGARGRFEEQNKRAAAETLKMTPKEAKAASGRPGSVGKGQGGKRGGRLMGLDVGGWDKVKLVVMEMATEQQAMGNRRFRDRLVGTGKVVLAEAAIGDGEWGIGMSEEHGRAIPQGSRRDAFAGNGAGRGVMAARERVVFLEEAWLRGYVLTGPHQGELGWRQLSKKEAKTGEEGDVGGGGPRRPQVPPQPQQQPPAPPPLPPPPSPLPRAPLAPPPQQQQQRPPPQSKWQPQGGAGQPSAGGEEGDGGGGRGGMEGGSIGTDRDAGGGMGGGRSGRGRHWGRGGGERGRGGGG